MPPCRFRPDLAGENQSGAGGRGEEHRAQRGESQSNIYDLQDQDVFAALGGSRSRQAYR